MPFAKMFYRLWKMAVVVAMLLLAGTLAHAQQAAPWLLASRRSTS
ncbi:MULTISPECIES: hypothetical protein [unclassified Rhizobium]|nr:MULTISPECIES: hypothetical protein [unclassified Rhizobium]